VRVIAGTARGRPLRAAAQTRPTADLIKGTIFSMLEAAAYKHGFEPDEEGNLAAALAWPRVLDLYAGSGALGIEALSRGASFAEFVEQEAEALRVIEANLRSTGLSERGRIHQSTALRAIRGTRLRGPYDLILADPPYADNTAMTDVASALAESTLLRPTSAVVLEHAAAATPPTNIGELPLHTTRKHGQTSVSLYLAAP
jgi:16S rRNA (guanine966-N2)-methyltransferase